MKRLTSAILARPKLVAATVLAVTLAFGAVGMRMQIDPSVEGMVVGNDPDLIYYRGFLERFGSDELAAVAFETPHLFQPETLRMIERLTSFIGRIAYSEGGPDGARTPLVDHVSSLTTIQQVRNEIDEDGETTLLVEPLLVGLPSSVAEQRALRKRTIGDPLYRGSLISSDPKDDPDAPLTTLVVAHVPYRHDDLHYRGFVKERIEEIVAREASGAQAFHLAGTVILKATLGETAEWDLMRLVPLMFGVTWLVLFLFFRSVGAIALPALTVVLAMTWTVGLLTLWGSYLNIVSAVLLPLVQVIGVATTIHVFSHYNDLARESREPRELVRRTLERVAWPCFLASLTTAVGFLSLSVSRILSIREVGIYAAFGVMAAWLIGMTLIPVALLRLRPPDPGIREPRILEALREGLDRLSVFTERFRWGVLAAAAVLIALAVLGIGRIRVETQLSGFLDTGHPMRAAYEFFEAELGGFHPLDWTLRTAPGEALEPAVLERVQHFQQWLEAQPEVDYTRSIVDYLKRINQEIHGGSAEHWRLPDSREEAVVGLLLLERAVDQERFLWPNWSAAEELRVEARVRADSSAVLSRLIVRSEQFLAAHVATAPDLVFQRDRLYPTLTGWKWADAVYYDLRDALGPLLGLAPGADARGEETLASKQIAARTTGVSLLYSNMVENLVSGQISSVTLALLAIWATLAALLRSAWGATLAMVPNVFPILIVLGFMGYSGITLNVGTVMVSAVCIGIATDDTLHFLSRYRLHLAEHGDCHDAVRGALREVGRPIVMTSVGCALGFLVLLAAEWTPHEDFGQLAAITMMAALVADLVLLPALLVTFRPKIRLPRARGCAEDRLGPSPGLSDRPSSTLRARSSPR